METSPPQRSHWSWKITVLIAVPLLILLLVFATVFPGNAEDKYITITMFVAAGAFGWIVGLVLSPDSRTEAKNFSTLWKSISFFLSGYLISKVDGLVGAIFDRQVLFDAANHLAAFRLIGTVAVMLLTAMLTYIVRIYGFGVGER